MINKTQVNWNNIDWNACSRPKSLVLEKSIFSKINIEHVHVNIIALLLGMASISGLYPFGISYVAALSFYQKDFLPAALLCSAGTVIALRDVIAIRHLAAIVIFSLAYFALKKVIRKKIYAVGILVFCSNLIAGTIFLAIRGFSPYDVVILFMESTLAAAFTYIIPGGMPWVFKDVSTQAEKTICIAILVGAILSIIRGIAVFGINIGEVVGTIVVLIAALLGGPGVGAASGIIMGITGYSLMFSPWAIAVLAFAGLIAGSFNKLGKAGVIAGFTLGYLIYNMYINSMGEILISLPVLFSALGVFLIFPRSASRTLTNCMNATYNDGLGYDLNERKSDILLETAHLMEELGKSFAEPLYEPNDFGQNYINSVLLEAQSKICYSCGMHRICWEQETQKTIQAFYKLVENYETNPMEKSIPRLFKARCSKTEDLIRLVEDKSSIYNLALQKNVILKNSCEEILNHFKQSAHIIRLLANENFIDCYDKSFGTKLFEKLKQEGLNPKRIYYTNEHKKDCIHVVKPACNGEEHCQNMIKSKIEQMTGEKICAEVIECPKKTSGTECHLKYSFCGSLEVSVGISGVSKKGFDVSGDGFSFMKLKTGKFLLALSDGMGVGKSAARQSERTLALLERLMECGFSWATTLKIVNSVMLATGIKESFSTLDIALIDTCDGSVEFIKAGAASGFIKHGNKTTVIKGQSLPVGIMDTINPSVIHKKVRSKDIIVMVTDGVIDALSSQKSGEDVLRAILSEIKTSNPQEIADEILKMAKMSGNIKDDMTVLAALVWKR